LELKLNVRQMSQSLKGMYKFIVKFH
jgi:hypothetical protein